MAQVSVLPTTTATKAAKHPPARLGNVARA
jgi:hypothetical protein